MYPYRFQILTMLNFVMFAYYIHSPTYVTVTSRKIRRKLNFAQVGIWYTCGQLYVYIERSPAEVSIPTRWKLTGRNTTAQLPVLSPNSIPLSSFQCSLITTRKSKVRFKNFTISIHF